MTFQHVRLSFLIKAGFTAGPLKAFLTSCRTVPALNQKARKRKILCKKVGYNKSVQALRSEQTAELKVSAITTFVGVIGPFVPPISPYSSRSSWCHQLA